MMEKNIIINFKLVGLFFFFLSILYFAAMTMSGLLNFLFYFILFIPVLSFIQIIISSLTLKYYQEFSSEHPIKGENIVYKITIANESILSNVSTEIKFRTIHPGSMEQIFDLNLTLKAKETFKKDYIVSCPYRGIYTVGFKRLIITDIFNWIRFSPVVWHRTFYVFPRIINLRSFVIDIQNNKSSTGTYQGFANDNTLLRDISQYRNGESIKHMYWKKFASTGTPFIKTYDKSSIPEVSIYLDLRRSGEANKSILEREDCSIEIAVALVKYFLEKRILVSVHAFGSERYDFSCSDISDFTKFHQSTINIYFKETYSPFKLFKVDVEENRFSSGSVIFITHIVDPEIFEYLTESANSERSICAVFNQSGMSKEERYKSQNYVESVKIKGGKIVVVQNPSTMKEDLEA